VGGAMLSSFAPGFAPASFSFLTAFFSFRSLGCPADQPVSAYKLAFYFTNEAKASFCDCEQRDRGYVVDDN
jgi:hypothetical protein